MKTNKPHRPKDINQLAKYIMELSTGEITEPKELSTVKPAPKKKGKEKKD
jgi:hypothetical protein